MPTTQGKGCKRRRFLNRQIWYLPLERLYHIIDDIATSLCCSSGDIYGWSQLEQHNKIEKKYIPYHSEEEELNQNLFLGKMWPSKSF